MFNSDRELVQSEINITILNLHSNVIFLFNHFQKHRTYFEEVVFKA